MTAVQRGHWCIGIDTGELTSEKVKERFEDRKHGEVVFDEKKSVPRLHQRQKSTAATSRCVALQEERPGSAAPDGGAGERVQRMRNGPAEDTAGGSPLRPNRARGDGGQYVNGNVQLLCVECNLKKDSRPVADLVRKFAQTEFRFPGEERAEE